MTASTTSLTTPLQVPQAPPLRPARDSFWTRIAAELAEAIGSGVYPPGQRLPSEHALAEQFGVNRHTIRRSLASLCSQGLVRITQGSGTYVEDFAVDLVLGKRTRHQQGLAQAGLRGSLVVLQAQTMRATAALAKALQVPARSPLLALRVRGDAEGQPLTSASATFPCPASRTWRPLCAKRAPSPQASPPTAWPTTRAAKAASPPSCPAPKWPPSCASPRRAPCCR